MLFVRLLCAAPVGKGDRRAKISSTVLDGMLKVLGIRARLLNIKECW
jgi:hypothetical protein